MSSYASAGAGIAGLLFFFGFFVLLGLWLMRPGAREKAQRYARIPLDEDREQ